MGSFKPQPSRMNASPLLPLPHPKLRRGKCFKTCNMKFPTALSRESTLKITSLEVMQVGNINCFREV